MSAENGSHVLRVSNDPAEAINEVALDELNRMNAKMVRLENENDRLKRIMAEMQKSLTALWSAQGTRPQQQQ